MEDPIKTNPARRLHSLLTVAISKECQNKQTTQAITHLFGLKDSTPLSIYRNFGKLMQLVASAEQSVDLIPAHRAPAFKSCFPPIYQALGTIQFAGQWQINTNAIREQEMHLLDLASQDLDAIVPEDLISRQQLDAFDQELESLRNEIGNATIDLALKALLLREISRLIDSITDYNVTGADGMKEAASTAIGRWVVDRQVLYKEAESPWVTKFYTIVGRIADVAAVAQGANQIGWTAAKLIEHFAS